MKFNHLVQVKSFEVSSRAIFGHQTQRIHEAKAKILINGENRHLVAEGPGLAESIMNVLKEMFKGFSGVDGIIGCNCNLSDLGSIGQYERRFKADVTLTRLNMKEELREQGFYQDETSAIFFTMLKMFFSIVSREGC